MLVCVLPGAKEVRFQIGPLLNCSRVASGVVSRRFHVTGLLESRRECLPSGLMALYYGLAVERMKEEIHLEAKRVVEDAAMVLMKRFNEEKRRMLRSWMMAVQVKFERKVDDLDGEDPYQLQMLEVERDGAQRVLEDVLGGNVVRTVMDGGWLGVPNTVFMDKRCRGGA